MFDALKSLQPSFPFNYNIYSTYPSKCFSVIFLLYKCYQIKSKTGLWKSSINIIKKRMDRNKKNTNKKCFSKLFSYTKQFITCQISNKKLYNAVKATHLNTNTLQPCDIQIGQEYIQEKQFLLHYQEGMLLT